MPASAPAPGCRRSPTAPRDDPGRRLITFRHVLPGLFAWTGSTQNCGNVLEWLGHRVVGTATWRETLADDLATVPPGAEGLLMLPYLHGERTPWWDAELRGAHPRHRPQSRPGAFHPRRDRSDRLRTAPDPRRLPRDGRGAAAARHRRRHLRKRPGRAAVRRYHGHAGRRRRRWPGRPPFAARRCSARWRWPRRRRRYRRLGRDRRTAIIRPARTDPALERARRGFDAGYDALLRIRAAMDG